MTKKEMTVAEAADKALAVPAELVGGVTIKGDQGGLRLGELKLFQGTASEAAQYGEHPRGSFIDCLDKKNLGKSVKIALLGGEKVFTKFVEGQKFPVYVVPASERHRVPPADLRDGSGKNGRGTAAREQVLGIVIVEGLDFPYLFRFKSTALAALTRTIQPLEDRRRLGNQIMGVYELTSSDDKGPGGEAYKRLNARPAGDLPTSMHDLARTTKAALDQYFAKGREAAESGETVLTSDGEEIPI